MSTFVEIVSVLQTLDLKSGQTMNSLHLRLPDGSFIAVAIEAPVLQILLEKIALGEGTAGVVPQGSTTPTSTPTPLTFGTGEVSSDPKIDPDQVAVFGGDVQAPAAPAPVAEAPRGRRQKPAMDDMGYPIMPGGSAGKDPGEIVGQGANQDEDGVASL